MKKTLNNLVTESTKVLDSKEDSTYTNSVTGTPTPSLYWKRQPPIELNLLNLRAKEKSCCEVCGNWAVLQCASCRSTFYCSMKHLEIDEALHRDICASMKVLRAPLQFSAFAATREMERGQYLRRADELYRYTLLRARTAVIKGQFDLGIAASRSSLRTSRLAHGNTPHAILPMAILTECYLSKKKLHKAQHCLSNCLALEMAFEDIAADVRAAIRHVEGLVSFKGHDYDNAKHCFAEQIYLYTILLDPDHISTASGYLCMAQVFLKKKKHLVARSLTRRTVDIWSMYVSSELEQQIEETSGDLLSVVTDDIPRAETVSEYSKMAVKTAAYFKNLQETADRMEAANGLQSCQIMLRKIDQDVVKPDDYIEIDYAQAGLSFIGQQYVDARDKFAEAINKCASQGLKDQPIYQRLLRCRRECDLRIKASKKRTGGLSRSHSRTGSPHPIRT